METKLFIPESVLLETEWVLRFTYGFPPPDVASGLQKLLGLANVHVDDAGKLARVLDWHEQGLDFADALHLADSDRLSTLVSAVDNKRY